ncbi:hypothetical protein [Streptomyces capitiformicae]|uniref:Uncharacterized protein n=1 Tax=Streptomyces capitiformicae TaxID=2014920 RepID=A0A919DD07_9ACTN|nr:hypothetical protein [Streptomyces capitiformicae]GHE34137.1 hypothetical protein GCM10017771_51550 [Streptomyces capitiformicae]
MSQTKQAAAAIATPMGAIAVAGLELVILAAAACTGGWVGSNAPGVPSGWAGALGGGLGLGLAAGVMQLLSTFKASLRELTRTSYSPAAERSMEEPAESLPSHPEDVMDLLTDAAQAGAAHEAAFYSGKVDPAGALLGKRGLWVGVDGTSAMFHLADGAYVYYEKDDSGKHPRHEYSFVAPATRTEPVPVTSMEQVRDLLEQHVTRELKDEPVAV